jgi:carbon storage regulator
MLVLSRKKNESIVINNDITVTVVEIRGDKVRLGIVAPKEVPVHRQEVYDAIHGKEGADGADPAGETGQPRPAGGAAGAAAALPSPVVVNSKSAEAPNRSV